MSNYIIVLAIILSIMTGVVAFAKWDYSHELIKAIEEQNALYYLQPSRPLTNQELTDLLMLQKPAVRPSTYGELSQTLKSQFHKKK